MNLFEALTKIENSKQCQSVLKDLCTPKEVEALEERWEVAKLLYTKKYTYREIAQICIGFLNTPTAADDCAEVNSKTNI